MIHNTRFLRSTAEPGEYQAICNCGWACQGTLEYVQARAATHDLDEIKEPPLRREGFVSGLPD